MGKAVSAPLAESLKTLLKATGIAVGKDTLRGFLTHCNNVAPWFWPPESLTLPSWEKLGGDIYFAKEQGEIDPMVMPIRELIRACLEDEKMPGLLAARHAFAKARSESSQGRAPQAVEYPCLEQ